jgi:hypothetical protein
VPEVVEILRGGDGGMVEVDGGQRAPLRIGSGSAKMLF